MIEIATKLQKLENFSGYAFVPYSEEDLEAAREFKPYQILRSKFSGPKNQRSWVQIKTYYKGCKKVSENTDNPDFNTKEKVDLQLRIKLGWIKETIVVDGRVQFIPKSISFKEMKHLEFCNYFDRAIDVMVKFLGVEKDDFIKAIWED